MGQTPAQLIEDRGGAAAVAAKLQMRAVSVRQWKRRNRIPRSRWHELIEAYPDLTPDALRAAEQAA